jgi:thioredoxin-dependent peroxiredoxin
LAKIRKGDAAPMFDLIDQDGTPWRMEDHLGKVLVVYFYPKDDTPGCLKEACNFRDRYEEFIKLGAEVVGISSDDQRSHSDFASKNQLPFRLLSDPGQKVRKEYGALDLFLPGRVTYVIDKKGVVRHVFSSQSQATKHIDEAFRTVEELAKE